MPRGPVRAAESPAPEPGDPAEIDGDFDEESVRTASGPVPVAPADSISTLEDVVRALEAREIDWRPDNGGIVSRCPVCIRSRGDSFFATLARDGTLQLSCKKCSRPTIKLLRRLCGANILQEESEAEERPGPPDLSPDDRDALHDYCSRFPRLGLASGRAQGFDAGTVHRLLWQDPDGDDPGEADIDRAVEAMMARHPLQAVGRRPEDYRVRDLLLGSTFRNRRVPSFGRMGREPESWQVDATAHLPGDGRAQAQQFLALYRDHLRGLFRISRGLPAELEGADALEFLRAIVDCPPCGALVGGVAKGKGARYCHHPRYCPWCMGRQAEELYQRLLAGPCGPARGRGRHLVLARVVVRTTTLGHPEDCYAWGPIERATRALREWADRAGAVGGLAFDQALPAERPGGSDHGHDLVILFEVETATQGALDRLRKATGIGLEQVEDDRPLASFEVGDSVLKLEVAAVPAEGPNALRYMVFGTAVGHKLAASGIEVNGRLAEKAGFGLNGLMRVMPWWCARPVEWFRHADEVRGLQLWKAFGSWRRAIPATVKPTRASIELDAMLAGIEARRRSARRRKESAARTRQVAGRAAGNRTQAARAAGSRAAVIELARPIFERLAAGGEPPGRRRLAEALAEAGHSLPGRVVDDVTALLRAEHEARA